jgi:hypothetical protein
MIREQIADRLTGGQFSEMKQSIPGLNAALMEQRGEIRKLERTVENMRDGVFTESAESDYSWISRINQDRQWVMFSGASSPQFRFITKPIVDIYSDMATYLYTFNPLIRRAVSVKTLFTFIRMFSVISKTKTKQAIIDTIIKDPLNQQAFFSKQAIDEADGELQRTGNLFIAVYRREDPMQVRVFCTYEITNIINDPGDAARPLFYVRDYIDENNTRQTKYYDALWRLIIHVSARPSERRCGSLSLARLACGVRVTQDCRGKRLARSSGAAAARRCQAGRGERRFGQHDFQDDAQPGHPGVCAQPATHDDGPALWAAD